MHPFQNGKRERDIFVIRENFRIAAISFWLNRILLCFRARDAAMLNNRDNSMHVSGKGAYVF
jgi:hypothetical protein